MKKYSGVEKLQMRMATLPSQYCKNILDLCSGEARSIKLYFEHGIVDSKTAITIVEKDSKAVSSIKNQFKKLSLPEPRIFNDNLQYCPYLGPYNLVNLDTCSTPSKEILDWIGQLNILPKGELNLWVTAFRNKGLWRQTLIDAFLYNQTGIKLLYELREKTNFLLDKISVEQQCVAGALASALSHYDFQLVLPTVINRPVGQYCDNRNTMYVYRFVNLKRYSKALRPSLDELLSLSKPTSYVSFSKPTYKKEESFDMMLSKKIIQAIKTGRTAETTKAIRKILRDADYLKKDKKMIKAGFKAQITKMETNKKVVQNAHAYIDKI